MSKSLSYWVIVVVADVRAYAVGLYSLKLLLLGNLLEVTIVYVLIMDTGGDMWRRKEVCK